MAYAKDLAAVRVRFSPSPTGHWQMGGVRTALFNWLFARQHGGVFILRIEDTDAERSRREYETEILETLAWLGLEWDEGPIAASAAQNQKYVGQFFPYRQSERTEMYKRYLQKLLDEGKAYYCYCTKEELTDERESFTAQGLPPKYSGHCRSISQPPVGKIPELIRFKTSEAKVEFKDMIRGHVIFDGSLFGDMVIARNLESPLYNFAVVVDDYEMKISHVIRGEDHLSNTPKQILIQKAIGAGEPIYAHLPLILAPNRAKLSKRFTEDSILSYRDAGYLPEAILNFAALLGWHPKDDQELFSLEELKKAFDLRRAQKAGAIFNEEKLDWLNAQHLRKLGADEIIIRLRPLLDAKKMDVPEDFLKKVISVLAPRMTTLADFFEFGRFFFKLPKYDPKILIFKDDAPQKTLEILKKVREQFASLEYADFHRDRLVFALAELIDEEGRGNVLWPLRVAVSGLAASPDPLEIVEILGKDESLNRLRHAIGALQNFLATA